MVVDQESNNPNSKISLSGLATKDNIDAGENRVKLPLGKLSDFAAKQNAIESDDLRNVGHGVLWKPRGAGGKRDITRGLSPSKVAGQWDADNSSDSAAVEGISLDYDHGSPKPRTRTRRVRQVRPTNLTLGDYHSTRLRVRLAAAETAGSAWVSIALHTRFIAAVTASGSWRAIYSATASAYSRLLGCLRRRESRSASRYSLSGIEIAVFIPTV